MTMGHERDAAAGGADGAATNDPGTGTQKRTRSERRQLSRPGPRPLSVAEATQGMLVQAVQVRPSDVVFLKGIIEASDGLANVFAERGGDLVLTAPPGRDAEFSELLQDLERDIGAQLVPPGR
ncbi:DUF4911 domain-containing protein [Chondromyces crocatus]|uniref:DUF4911 domain-containing protein n=1 Tax=Chondromyces crocatus TaxID=52 RepID=A0A0K1EBS2_CHOCO|nr:DUF4911 domain-containing protein [Chondromyces crocatus]AKT38336.1 uncharacterized protein CMC5_024810 [Chondromyces crocatus]